MTLKIRSSTVPSLCRRLPLVGALCMLSFGLTNLTPSLSSSSFKTPWSGFSRQLPSVKGIHSGSGGMEGNSNTVPSVVVYVTVPTKEAGKKLAESIVTEKLAACVNRVPGVESVYQWEGKIQTDSEELLIIKTRESLLEPLEEHVKVNHEYDVPEVIAIPITGGSLQYLEWLKNSTRD
ncbi:protein CutA, chloroplastic-like isoform X2 [Papaver somniferum]|uniref:protein CutA, chloroplastic-like isoform X2 n=1 Tax=Papaver somniferum TaxID=3469 RepID=UPI000E703E90|nr:protein CutA, chloroplastic-like isoform X2 [Papaver somniferum]